MEPNGLSMIDVDIEGNVITMTAATPEEAERFLRGIIALFAAVAGRDRLIAKDEADPNTPIN